MLFWFGASNVLSTELDDIGCTEPKQRPDLSFMGRRLVALRMPPFREYIRETETL